MVATDLRAVIPVKVAEQLRRFTHRLAYSAIAKRRREGRPALAQDRAYFARFQAQLNRLIVHESA